MMGFCQEDAGILSGGELTQSAKDKVSKNILEEMVKGTNGIGSRAFACGPNVAPIPNADKIDFTDASKFGDFQTNVFKMYEKIVVALNFEGQFMFAPIVVDPVALAISIGAPKIPKLNFPNEFIPLVTGGLPLLAPQLGFPLPATLAAKLPSLIVPAPPTLKLPSIDIDVQRFDALFKFSNWPSKLSGLFVDLTTKIPSLVTGILSLNFSTICEAVTSSGLFGEFDPRSTMQVLVAKNLAQSVGESMLIAIVGATLGSSPDGIVGGLGRHFGYSQ